MGAGAVGLKGIAEPGGGAGTGEDVVEVKDGCLPNNRFGVVEEKSVVFVFCGKGECPNVDDVPFVVPKGKGDGDDGLG